jgi:hypothetical protein
LLQRTLNLVWPRVFLIFTDRASFRRAVRRNSLISLICLGCRDEQRGPHSGVSVASGKHHRPQQPPCNAWRTIFATCVWLRHKQALRKRAGAMRESRLVQCRSHAGGARCRKATRASEMRARYGAQPSI